MASGAAAILRDSSTETAASASPWKIHIGRCGTCLAMAAKGSGSDEGTSAGYRTSLDLPRNSDTNPQITATAANRPGWCNARYQLPLPPAERPVRQTRDESPENSEIAFSTAAQAARPAPP